MYKQSFISKLGVRGFNHSWAMKRRDVGGTRIAGKAVSQINFLQNWLKICV